MVQIIQSGPSSATLRQQALDQALQGAIQGYATYDKQKKDEALTLRQQALQDQQVNLKLAEMGIDANAKDLMDYANGTYKPKEISPAQEAIPAQYGKELQGPVMPEQDPLREVFSRAKEATPAVMGNANPLMNYTESKKAQLKAASEKAKLETESQQTDINYKKAQTSNMEAESPYKAQKLQAEINKINSDANLSPITKRKLLAEAQKAEAEAGKISRESIGTGAAGAKLSKMSAEAQSKVGSIASGIKAIKEMGIAMDKGILPKYIDSSTPGIGGLISDNDFTAQQKVLNEVIGRIQSGGAIGEEEVKNFKALGPRPGDTPAQQKQKLADQKSFLINKLTAFGMKESELAELGFDIGGSQSKQTQNSVASHPQVNQAMEWAQANPNDPRAKEIMARVQ